MAARSYAALAIGYYYCRRYGGFVGCYAAGQAGGAELFKSAS